MIVTALALANAIVRSEADARPELSVKIWPAHPLALRSAAMEEVGLAAARGASPQARTMERLRRLSARAPLEPEPFLVEAALALKGGDAPRARRLLIEAQRDPRSPAARYLLADFLIRNGDIAGGLREFIVLSRIAPGATGQLLPVLAAYARTPGAIPELRQLVGKSPHLRAPLLNMLAADPANADLVLALATPVQANDQGRWKARLLKGLVDAGMYSKAFQLWGQLSGVPGPWSGLFRPDFANTAEPPPFNWAFAKGEGGIAEPAAGGALRVLHYGRTETRLATQLLLLPAGHYALAFAVSGDAGVDGQLRWRIACLPSGPRVLDLPLRRGGAAGPAGRFQVPASGCQAQWIELVGTPLDSARSSDATISQLSLSRVGG